MNAVMAGMIPVMVTLMSRDMLAMGATSSRFWGVMSLATVVGAAVAYPVNVWLVAVQLKHGMGTVRALRACGHAMQAEAGRDPAILGAPRPAQQAGVAHEGIPGMGDRPTGQGAGGHGGMVMASAASGPQLAAVTVLTLLMLGAGVMLADLSGGFGASSGMDMRGEAGGPAGMVMAPAR